MHYLLPRTACISDPTLIWAIVLANFVVLLSYMAIPAALFVIALKVRAKGVRLPLAPIGRLFIAFILSCGGTHAMGILVFFTALYRLESMILWLTAGLSSLTVYVLAKNVPVAVKIICDAHRLGAFLEQRSIEAET